MVSLRLTSILLFGLVRVATQQRTVTFELEKVTLEYWYFYNKKITRSFPIFNFFSPKTPNFQAKTYIRMHLFEETLGDHLFPLFRSNRNHFGPQVAQNERHFCFLKRIVLKLSFFAGKLPDFPQARPSFRVWLLAIWSSDLWHPGKQIFMGKIWFLRFYLQKSEWFCLIRLCAVVNNSLVLDIQIVEYLEHFFVFLEKEISRKLEIDELHIISHCHLRFE